MEQHSKQDVIAGNSGKVILKDIARFAGCSAGTASAVINKSSSNTRISPKTRQRILQIAKSLDYRPMFAAQSLARQSSRTIGIYIAPSPHGGIGNGAYEGRLLRGIEKACIENQFGILLVNLAADQTIEQCVQHVYQLRVDGLILIQTEVEGEIVEQLSKMTDRVVFIDRQSPDQQITSVMFDNDGAMDLAVEHLVGLGHRRIGFLGSCLVSPRADSIARTEGFITALRKQNLQVDQRWIHDVSQVGPKVDSHEEYCQREGVLGIEAMIRLDKSERPTALVAYNDLVAASACRKVYDVGYTVPNDFSIVGVDDSDFCSLLVPSLTSVRQPLEKMGYYAAESLICRICNKSSISNVEYADMHNRCLKFEPTIIKRESTCLVNNK